MDTLDQLHNRIKKNDAEHHSIHAPAKSFTSKEIRLDESAFFFLPGYEKLLLTLYFIFLPYLAGILFLFIYVAKVNFDVFVSLNHESSFIFSWCIGYECLAALALGLIVRSAIRYNLALYRSGHEKSVFIRPA